MLRPVVCVLFVGACGVPDPVRQQIADGSKGPVDSPPASGTGAPAAPVDEDEDGVVAADDCDDGDATVFPGAPELCDRRDNDCDGGVDNGLAASVGATGYRSLQAAIDAALAEVPSPPVAVCPPGEVPEALATVALTGAQSLTVNGSVPTAPAVIASADGASLFTVTDRASLHVTLSGTSTVINNTAGVGGGAFLEAEEDAELDCRGVAWGTPLTDDNGPHDIWLAGPDRAVNFDGASSTFLCNADVCD